MGRLFVCLKSLLVIFLLMSSNSLKAQENILLKDGIIVSSGAVPVRPTRDVVQADDGVVVTYRFEEASIQKDSLFPECVNWRIEGFGTNDAVSQGAYPFRTDTYTLPHGYSAQVAVVDSSYIDFDYCLSPARPPVAESGKGFLSEKILPVSPFKGFFPRRLAHIKGVEYYRGTGIAQVVVCPLQYSYEGKKIRAYTFLTYKITFVKKEKVNRNSAFVSRVSPDDHLLSNTVVNGFSVASRGRAAQTLVSAVRDYLVLSCPKYGDAVSKFCEWKKTMGFRTHVVVKEEWTPQLIKETVQKVYDENSDLYYLLIIGSHEDIPAQYCYVIEREGGDSIYHCTDMYYACMDGEKDSLPDLYYGRLPVSTITEANAVIDKIMQYEKNPTVDTSFYETGLNCAFFEDGSLYSEKNKPDGYEDVRFVKTSEEVRDYLMSQQKNVNRVYYTEKKDVIPSFYNNTKYSFGEPLPDELKRNDAWQGNAADINNFINKGTFYVLYRGHAHSDGWAGPTYKNRNINLNNEDKYPVMFSLTCLSGQLDDAYGCFAEQLLNKKKSGCVAVYAASYDSYSGYNDALCNGMFDAIWPEPGLRPRFKDSTTMGGKTPVPTYELGQILFQGMTRMKETYGVIDREHEKYTEEVFYCYGDPSMMIYTDVPTSFENVKVERNNNSIHVATKEPAKITFYNQWTDEVVSTQGNSLEYVTKTPQYVSVCISKHNKIPFVDKGIFPMIVYLQNEIYEGSQLEGGDCIKVGSNVNPYKSEGDVIFKGKMELYGNEEVILEKGTIVEQGAELDIMIEK